MSNLIDVRYSTTLRAITCGECHIPFGVPVNLDDAARADGRRFWCPNGHRIGYSETENKRLQRERDRLVDAKERLVRQRDEALAEAEHNRRVAIGTKGALVATQRRIAKGVCPCCKRSFVNVERHMSNQHPDFGGDSA